MCLPMGDPWRAHTSPRTSGLPCQALSLQDPSFPFSHLLPPLLLPTQIVTERPATSPIPAKHWLPRKPSPARGLRIYT